LRIPPIRTTLPLIAIFEWWPVGGEKIPKLGLHLHGDEAARSLANELTTAIQSLHDPAQALSLPELDARMQGIAADLGLDASVTKTRCASDLLEEAADLSVWRKEPE
jgi:hypothetical protein